MVEMLPGYHTQNFVSEVFRLTDGKAAQKSSMALKSDAYEWIKRLKPSKGEFKCIKSIIKAKNGSKPSGNSL